MARIRYQIRKAISKGGTTKEVCDRIMRIPKIMEIEEIEKEADLIMNMTSEQARKYMENINETLLQQHAEIQKPA